MGYPIDTESENASKTKPSIIDFSHITIALKGVLNMSATPITQNTFKSEVLDSKLPVLVDFWAPWCGPCRMVGPILDQIAEERPDIKVCKINVDEEPELAGSFQVMSIPTLVVMQDGKVANRSMGAQPKARILSMLN